jgi:hypothetical protein
VPSDADLQRRYEAHLADIRRRMRIVYAGLAVAALGLAGIVYLRFDREAILWVFAGFILVFACGIVIAEYGRRTIRTERRRVIEELRREADPAGSAVVGVTRVGAERDTEETGA